jgi:hypothetical protein
VSLHARLSRLEQQIGVAHSCPACRHRQGRAVLIEAHKQPDGTVVSNELEPVPCAVCGQVPERIIEVVLSEVQTPGLESASPEADGSSGECRRVTESG